MMYLFKETMYMLYFNVKIHILIGNPSKKKKSEQTIRRILKQTSN